MAAAGCGHRSSERWADGTGRDGTERDGTAVAERGLGKATRRGQVFIQILVIVGHHYRQPFEFILMHRVLSGIASRQPRGRNGTGRNGAGRDGTAVAERGRARVRAPEFKHSIVWGLILVIRLKTCNEA